MLGTIPLAIVARMTRSSMLEVLGEDFIRTARAKGLSPGRVVVVHALRNALIPVVTVIGLCRSSALLGGAILTETIFSWPGVGHWLVESIQRRDYPVLQGGTLLVAILVILVNLGVDVDLRLASIRASADEGVLARLLAERPRGGAGLGVDVLALIVRRGTRADLIAPHSPIEQFRTSNFLTPPVWQAGRHRRRSRSAPTMSGATCCRA